MPIFDGKTFKRAISLLSLLLIVCLILHFIGKVLEPISYAAYFNHDISVVEADKDDADIVFIGASRVYRTFVPEVFEAELGLNCVINAGSSGQPVCGTYYQLKDLIERVNPSCVWIGVTWDELIDEPILQGKLIVYDRLSAFNKVLMLNNCFKGSEKLYGIYAYRFRDNLGPALISTIKQKEAVVKSNYTDYSETSEYYADKGFVYSYNTYEIGTIPIRGGEYSNDKIIPKNLKYLDACIQMCKEKGITVNLVTGPTSVMRMYAVSDYQEAVDFYTAYAESKGIHYYNLNYLKGREDFLSDELMHDYNHVNGEGALVISKLFAEIIAREEKEEPISDYFYKDFDEFKADVKRIIAVSADITFDEEKSNKALVSIVSMQNDDVKPYYQLTVSYGEGQTETTTWTENNEIEINLLRDSDFTITVRAKAADNNFKEAYQIYKF